MKFTKMHGAGNDFLMIESAGEERDWGALSIAMCDRHFGIGSDSSGAGNLFLSGALTASLAVSSGITPSFAIGALTATCA